MIGTTRAQLICLPSYVNDNGLAGCVVYAWNALSQACHHYAYELAPIAGELSGSLHVAEGLESHVEAASESKP